MLSSKHVHKVAFSSNGLINLDEYSGEYSVQSVFEDVLTGTTLTEVIWDGRVVNSAHIARMLADPFDMSAASGFFTSRTANTLFMTLFNSITIKVPGYKCTLADVHAATRKLVKGERATDNAVSAIVEMVMPLLVANDLVVSPADRPPVAIRHVHPFTRHVTIEALVDETTRQEIERAVKESSANFTLDKAAVYSTKAVAQQFANALFPLGRALRFAYSFDVMMDDCARAVRAVIDPLCEGLEGDIDPTILKHPVINTLSTNHTFITAALKIEEGDSISLQTSDYKFEQWIGPMMTMLTSSDRFMLRRKEETLAPYGILHVEDLENFRRLSVVYEHARMDPVALNVVAIPDDTMPDALVVDRSHGRIDAHIAAAYGSSPEAISPAVAASHLQFFARQVCELGNDDARDAVEGAYVVCVRPINIEDLALLLADSIRYRPSAPSELAYVLTSTNARARLTSGVLEKRFVITTDPAELLLCVEPRESPTCAAALPQLLPRQALGASLFTEPGVDSFTRATTRYAVSQAIGRARVQGSLRLSEFETGRDDQFSVLVVPRYNLEILECVTETMEAAFALVGDLDPLYARFLTRTYVQAVVDMARSVNSGFRSNVHRRLVRKSKTRVSQEDVNIMSADLNRPAVHGFTDVFAAAFFFAVQGMGERLGAPSEPTIGAVEVEARSSLPRLFSSLWRDDALQQILMDLASSDRINNQLTE